MGRLARGGAVLASAIGRGTSCLSEKNDVMVARSAAWLRRYGFAVIVYLGVTWLTDAYLMGDSIWYANDILASRLWEFGHLLWRPLGWLVSQVFMPFSRPMVEADARANVIAILMALNWLAGLLSVFMLHSVVSKISQRAWVPHFATLAFVVSQGFLNFAQTGTSYLPGLSLLLLGMYLSIRDGDRADPSSRTGVPAGLALAGAVLLWFPYILSIPAGLAFPLAVFGIRGSQWRLVLRTAVACALGIVLMYGTVAASIGIYTFAGFQEWIVSSAHGITGVNGLPRMALGLARSFTNMGNDGIILKRFLLGDPYNPVSVWGVVQLSPWKVVLFYLFVGSMVIALLRSELGKRTLAILILSAIPNIAFAMSWQGGDIERYLPLYPFVFVSLSNALASDRSSALLKGIAFAFLASAAVSNIGVMAKSVLLHHQQQVMVRIKDLQPFLKPQSRVVTVKPHDEVWALCKNSPFHSICRSGFPWPHALVAPGSPWILRWREDFASLALSLWAEGGDVWASKRVFARRPRAEWNWAEGDDPGISWADIFVLFSRLEVGPSVGGDDGFALLLPSSKNRDALKEIARRHRPI